VSGMKIVDERLSKVASKIKHNSIAYLMRGLHDPLFRIKFSSCRNKLNILINIPHVHNSKFELEL
jgi:hypothetical protein